MDKKVKAGIIAIAVGIVSLLASIGVSGIDYMVWETNAEKGGPLVASTPTWILVWHALSFAIALLGAVWLIVSLVKARKITINYEDYVGMPRRKYWIGAALIAMSVLVAVVSAFLPLVQWYADTENARFLYIDLAFSVVSVTLLLAGGIRLIDDIIVNSRISKTQQKAIV